MWKRQLYVSLVCRVFHAYLLSSISLHLHKFFFHLKPKINIVRGITVAQTFNALQLTYSIVSMDEKKNSKFNRKRKKKQYKQTAGKSAGKAIGKTAVTAEIPAEFTKETLKSYSPIVPQRNLQQNSSYLRIFLWLLNSQETS